MWLGPMSMENDSIDHGRWYYQRWHARYDWLIDLPSSSGMFELIRYRIPWEVVQPSTHWSYEKKFTVTSKKNCVDTLSRKNLLRDQASQRDMTPLAKMLRSGFIR